MADVFVLRIFLTLTFLDLRFCVSGKLGIDSCRMLLNSFDRHCCISNAKSLESLSVFCLLIFGVVVFCLVYSDDATDKISRMPMIFLNMDNTRNENK